METVKHTAVYCDIEGCHEDGTHWVEFKGYSNQAKDTFYLCEEHEEELGNGTGQYKLLNYNGVMLTREIAVYSCNDLCLECNPD